jgi:signal peptidase I
MDFDLTAALVIAVAATGAVVLVAKVRSTLSRDAGGPHSARLRVLVEYAWSLFPILVIVLLVRSFLFEPFRIPSASMMPGLVDGDFIVVDKFSYGLRVPLINRKVRSIGEPRRGDVVVFRSPANPAINLIKRLVGLPGERIVVRNNRVFVNGALIPLRADGLYAGDFGFTGSQLEVETFDGAEHVIMFAANRSATDFDGTVPAGHYLFMGDNRNDSEDSRFAEVGFVPEANLVGHARRIWMNWRIPGWPTLSRIGMRIR